MKPGLHALAAAAAVLAGALAAAPAHALFEDDEARKAIIELRGRVELQNRDTKARLEEIALMIEARTKELAERLDRLEQMARGQLELQSQIDAMRQELDFAHPMQLENINPRTRLQVGFEWGIPDYMNLIGDYEHQFVR
ncbi:MAG TPA: hypothetical protein VIT02_05130, partial [Burkholderiaceae bacterium]